MRPRHPRRGDDGAAAVEFALVCSLLFLMLFGTLQYGLYFNDSLNVRQGVRDAARQGVVEDFGTCSASTNSGKLLCTAKEHIGSLTGTTYVKVAVPSTGWAKGSALTVCAAVSSDGGVGLLPMPNDGWITSKTQMYIEQEAEKASWSNAQDSLPAGQDWSWC